MPLYTAESLILRTYKLGEADRIVVFLTRDRGKRRGVARGARRVRSRFLGALEPLTLGRVAYFEHEQRELVRVDEIEVFRSPLGGGGREGLGHVGYFAELLDEWAPEGSPNEKLFRLGASVAGALGEGVPTDRLARYFEYWLLRLEGLYPSFAACPRCASEFGRGGAIVALGERVYLCRRCGRTAGSSAAVLSADALAFLRAATRQTPQGLTALPLPARAGRELEIAHQVLIAAHLEKELKSPRVMRDLK